MKGRLMSCKVWRGTPAARLVPLAAAAILLALGAPVLATGLDSMSLALGDTRVHPDSLLNLGIPVFNVFTDTFPPAGWGTVAVDSLSSPFAFTGDSLYGTFYSEVWQNTSDNHLLFLYRISNTGVPGSAPIRQANIAGFSSGLAVSDTGIIHSGGTSAFSQGDVLSMARQDTAGEVLTVNFQETDVNGNQVLKLLAAGETSSWFYFETDATTWGRGIGAVIDGSGHGDIPVLVPNPIPEPATVAGLLLGIGSVVRYVRKRRLA